jgi:hypothetical protein
MQLREDLRAGESAAVKDALVLKREARNNGYRRNLSQKYFSHPDIS